MCCMPFRSAVPGPGRRSWGSTVREEPARAFLRPLSPGRPLASSVVPIDDFYVPRGIDVCVVSDAVLTPWKNIEASRLLQEVLHPLTVGEEGSYRRYDWGSDALAERRGIPAGGLVLVEGVYALMRPLTDYYHFKVWMDCSRELRLERGTGPRWAGSSWAVEGSVDAGGGQVCLDTAPDGPRRPRAGLGVYGVWRADSGSQEQGGGDETQESWRVAGHVASGHIPALRHTRGSRPDGAGTRCCQTAPRSAPELLDDGR